ncbi:hypothetical protein [Amycolatopsis sp. SID8362]|uniref:hypothetical protein n=1 Tax=Amycolatopsis sp. SID8362 TaxID=2690346 RepID=UPI001944DF87|nr:hypothetical protein [Amycolatopsis sp. SID8362]
MSGPHFGNAVMTLDVDGREATATLLRPGGDEKPVPLTRGWVRRGHPGPADRR